MTLIECIANFSEAKNKATLDALISSIESFDEVKVLDLHKDIDHNRSVISFIGNENIFKAAYQAVKTAAELIDLSKHEGKHPRIGSTDVLPFVALKNISEEQLIEKVNQLAKKIANELNIPIYLYEKSALKTERKNLADIRNKEHLKDPDFGPKENLKTGKTAIGVRDILIAYNINLNTKNLKIAKEIAKEIRESNNGLKGVKALGIMLESKNTAQVSMNLTDYKITNMTDVFETIDKLAKKNEVEILESELIGLTPQAGMGKMTHEELKIFNWNKDKIIEKHYK